MSSAILSPHTSAIPMPGSVPARPRRTPAARRRQSRDHTSASPVPTTISTTTTMSTRSRQRISRSPSGADHSLDKTSTSSGSSQKGKEKELPPPPITDPEPEEKVEQEILEEEGELELDISDTITVNGHEVSSIGSEKLDVEDAAKPDPVIRLVMGQKRKPEVVQEDEKVDVEKMEMDDEAKGDESKRAPRKKRKWLKKGEVDPDDPIAVGRQKERHKVIDEALAHLDMQLALMKNGKHPQLVWMLDELETRRNKQLSRLEARYEADMSDLTHLRDHEKQQAMLNWKMHRDELADGMTAENRHKLSQLQQERTALKRDRMTLPNLRDGRGGGGWAFYDKHLLSTGEQRRAPINVAGQERQRRSVSLAVRGATLEDAEKDLVLLGLRKAKKQTRSPSPPPPHRPTAHLPPQPVEHHRTPLPPPWPTSVSNSKRYDMYRPPSRHEVPASNRNDKYAEDRLDHRKVYAPPPEAYHPTPASYEYYPHALVQDQHRERDRMEREKQRERERRKAAIPVPPPSRQKYDYWAAPPSLPAKGRNDLVIPPYNPMGTGRDMAPPPPPRVKP